MRTRLFQGIQDGNQAATPGPTCDIVSSCMRRPQIILICLSLFAAYAGLNAQPPAPLGIFTNEGPVGAVTKGSLAAFDAAKNEYHITGGGANIWAATDAFYFVWKKVSGDVTLQADVAWSGASPTAHRKAVLMFRQNLDADSAYADAASHGDGSTALQFRGAAKEQSYQIFTTIEGPVRIRIVKKGARYMMYAGKPGEYLNPVGPAEFITLNGEYYVGIGVCSHDAARLETAVFSNVKIEQGSNY